MKSPALSFEEVSALLREEDGVLFWRVHRGSAMPGQRAGTIHFRDHLPYAHVGINKHTYMVANVVFLLHKGRWPAVILDHEDGNSLNNKIGNLREVTQAENTKNFRRSKRNTSGITGVAWHKGASKWRAYIQTPSGIRHLGVFSDIEAAASARKAAQAEFGYHPNHGRAA